MLREQCESKDVFPTAINRKGIVCIAFGVSPLVDAFAITFDVKRHKEEGGRLYRVARVCTGIQSGPAWTPASFKRWGQLAFELVLPLPSPSMAGVIFSASDSFCGSMRK